MYDRNIFLDYLINFTFGKYTVKYKYLNTLNKFNYVAFMIFVITIILKSIFQIMLFPFHILQ